MSVLCPPIVIDVLKFEASMPGIAYKLKRMNKRKIIIPANSHT